MIVGVMSTALITPLYGLYKDLWQLLPSDVSLIYAIYMGGALCGLLCMGRLPDQLGFKPVLFLGVILALIGTVMSVLAWDMVSLCVGRFIVGLGSSALTTSSTIGLKTLAPKRFETQIALITSLLIVSGFALGPLVGGIIGQWAPNPLVMTYLPTILLCSIAIFVFIKLPWPSIILPANPKPLKMDSLIPKLTLTEKPFVKTFAITCSLAFLAFSAFGLYASLAPLFLEKLIPWHGPIVSGGALAVILFGSACIQLSIGRLPVHLCGFFGLLSLALSNALLMANLWLNSGFVFGLGVLFTAAGHALTLLAGMNMLNRITNDNNRSGVFATYLVVGYLGSMLPMMAIGWIADHYGMPTALCVFCSCAVLMASICSWLFVKNPQAQASA